MITITPCSKMYQAVYIGLKDINQSYIEKVELLILMTENNAKRTSSYSLSNISSKYDRLNNIISFEQHKLWRKHVMKDMHVKVGSKEST